ncbi:MAG TPA: hypothetical protein VMZ92_17685 [Planctomycetota bacterium]|nr:hypothetical protein [Planctomycetota bacterium]
MATARRFAATLGIIAFVFVAGFGWWQGADVNWVLLRGLLALIIFAVLGFVTGLIGAAIAKDSANEELKRKMLAEQVKRKRVQEARTAREKQAEENRGSREQPTAATRQTHDTA